MTETQETLHFLDYWRVIRSRKEIIIAVFLVVVLTGVLITYSMPKEYMASVVVQVEEDAPDLDVWRQERQWFNPLFMRTQFEIIQSRPVIEEVIRRTALDRILSKAYGYDNLPPKKCADVTATILSGKMRVQQYRDTNLIEIQISLSEPKEKVTEVVAEVAQTVAEVYKAQRAARVKKAKTEALKALEDSLDEQSRMVVKKTKEVQDIIEKYKLDVVDIFDQSASALVTERVRHLETLRVETRMELAEKESVHKIITGLPPDKLRSVAPRVVADPELLELLSSKASAEVRLTEAQSAFGEKHPTVLGLKAAIKDLDTKIDTALVALQRGVNSSYEKAKSKFDIIEGELTKLTQSERGKRGAAYREYDIAFEDLERIKKVRESLEIKHVQEMIVQRIPSTSVEIIEPAKSPDIDDPVSPNMLLNIILSILVGLGSGIGLAYFIEYLDTSVKTIEDVERNLNTPVLGVIPQKVKALSDDSSNTAHSEAYRVLRTNIQFSKKMKGGKNFCVTSGSVGEGKSLTLSNLAHVCAQLGDRTLIVDTDLHRPRQHKILKVSNSVGIANVLVGELLLEDAIIATEQSNLDFLPSGKLDAGVHGLLDTSRMKEIVSELGESYDIVFYDSPPIIGVSDASLLVREVDGVLLVIQHRKYPLAVSIRARSMAENLGANVIGVVLNNINISRDYSYYYYHHHYYSYPQKQGGESRRK